MTSVEWAIRPVEPADLSELVPLMEAYCGFYDTAPGAPALTVLAEALLAAPDCEGMQLLARDQHDRAVGFATMYWSWDTTEAVRTAIMHDLYVDPAVRGTGVGRALIEACGVEAARRGKGRLDWQTAPGNARAQRLYDAMTSDRSTWVCYGLAL